MVAVTIVARILGGVFDPKTSVLGSPGIVLATLGAIVVTLASPRDPKGSPMSEREVLGRFRALHSGTHFDTFSGKNLKKNNTNCAKVGGLKKVTKK